MHLSQFGTFLKILSLEIRLLHSQSLTNSRFHFLITVQLVTFQSAASASQVVPLHLLHSSGPAVQGQLV